MNADKLPFVLKGVGLQDKQCHITRKSGLPYYQLIFSIKGEGLLIVDNKTIRVQEDQMIFLESNKPHEYQSSVGDWKTGWIIFTGNYIDETVKELELCDSNIYTTTPVIKRIYKEILNLKSNDKKNVLLSCKIYEILIMMSHPENQVKVPDSIQLVIDMINSRYAEALTLDMMSSLIHVTPQYLCKYFKETVSVTPIEYLKLKRLEAAKDLLLNTQLSIKIIAKNVGYNDHSYFGSLFKKHEGMTAKTYRGF